MTLRTCVLILLAGTFAWNVWACNSGTVRDAAFSGRRDEHRLCYFFAEGEPAAEETYLRIEAWFRANGDRLNVHPEQVNTSDPEVRWSDYGMTGPPPQLPVTALVGSSMLFRHPFVIDHWEPAPSNEELDQLFHAPSMEKAKERLVDIWGVVLYAVQDTAQAQAGAWIEAAVKEWGDSHEPGLAFLRVDPEDPGERLFTALAELGPEAPECAAVVFGRGRLMAPLLRGEELTKENLYRLLDQLTVPCTCLADSTVMGLDLPVRWEEALDIRFAALEAASGYSETPFEEQVQAMVDQVDDRHPRILAALLLPLALAGAAALASIGWLIYKNRRTAGSGNDA